VSLTPNPRTTSTSSTTPPLSSATRSSRHPDNYNNAKFEDLATRPLKPIYEGSPKQLVPFLNCLDIRCHDEGWYPVTFITLNQEKLDLLRDFTTVMESTIRQEASS
jgi:hypothetical protein